MTQSPKLYEINVPLFYLANIETQIPILFQSDIGLTVLAFTSDDNAALYVSRERIACQIVELHTWDSVFHFCSTPPLYPGQSPFACIEIDPIDCRNPGVAKFLRIEILKDLQS
jgi:hypothetical protein